MASIKNLVSQKGQKPMKIVNMLIVVLAGHATLALSETTEDLTIQASDFNCMLDMEPVRGFYVDNLIDGKLSETLATARAETGQYPAGSVVQLVPAEVMVKHPEGFRAATNDWEFFELNVSAKGTEIGKRGFVDVVNRFGGNCFACHAQARPEFDLICETGHGCDPIPLTPKITKLLQNTDVRCGGRYTPTAEEIGILEALAAQFGG